MKSLARLCTVATIALLTSACTKDDVTAPPDALPQVCGTNLALTGGALPAGWSSETLRGGPGLANNRLEGAATDGGGVVLGPVESLQSVGSVTIEFDALVPTTSSGAFVQVGLRGTSLNYVTAALTGVRPDSIVFRTTTSTGPFDFSSQTPQTPRAMGVQIARYRLSISGNQATWRVASTTGTELVSNTLTSWAAAPLATANQLYIAAYQTVGASATWIDNISVICGA